MHATRLIGFSRDLADAAVRGHFCRLRREPRWPRAERCTEGPRREQDRQLHRPLRVDEVGIESAGTTERSTSCKRLPSGVASCARLGLQA